MNEDVETRYTMFDAKYILGQTDRAGRTPLHVAAARRADAMETLEALLRGRTFWSLPSGRVNTDGNYKEWCD